MNDLTGTRPRKAGTSLVTQISDKLRHDIDSGLFKVGDRLPSEADLTRAHSVSRTVVREAIAILRSDGLVEARKGSGVFVLEPADIAQQPFSDLNTDRVSGVIELLELRSAVEIRAAGLAASRRSAAQLDDILRAHDAVAQRVAESAPTREADFNFHVAIAEATQNRRFGEFLALIRTGIVPRAILGRDAPDLSVNAPNPDLMVEHARVVDAIVDGDATAAETAMKTHLNGSLRRYRALLRTVGSG